MHFSLVGKRVDIIIRVSLEFRSGSGGVNAEDTKERPQERKGRKEGGNETKGHRERKSKRE